MKITKCFPFIILFLFTVRCSENEPFYYHPMAELWNYDSRNLCSKKRFIFRAFLWHDGFINCIRVLVTDESLQISICNMKNQLLPGLGSRAVLSKRLHIMKLFTFLILADSAGDKRLVAGLAWWLMGSRDFSGQYDSRFVLCHALHRRKLWKILVWSNL